MAYIVCNKNIKNTFVDITININNGAKIGIELTEDKNLHWSIGHGTILNPTIDKNGNFNGLLFDKYDFEKFEKYIDNQLKEFGVPYENQAKDMVSKRDLIWVDDYKRDDGTPVKGYYRRK